MPRIRCFNPKTILSDLTSHLFFETNVVERVNSGKLVSWWHVPLIVHVTIWQFRVNLNFWENWAIWNKYKHLAIPNDARLEILKDFFILEQRNIYTWLYVSVTGHITIWHILRKNKSMRSEPQNICHAFDVLTPKLSSLIRLSHLFF